MSLFELLAKHGIEVPEEKKQGLETEFSESYREAQEFKELNTELEGVKGQLSQANEQIAGFKELDIEGVKQKAAEWEQKYNQAAQDSAREIEQLKFDFALPKHRHATRKRSKLCLTGTRSNTIKERSSDWKNSWKRSKRMRTAHFCLEVPHQRYSLPHRVSLSTR